MSRTTQIQACHKYICRQWWLQFITFSGIPCVLLGFWPTATVLKCTVVHFLNYRGNVRGAFKRLCTYSQVCLWCKSPSPYFHQCWVKPCSRHVHWLLSYGNHTAGFKSCSLAMFELLELWIIMQVHITSHAQQLLAALLSLVTIS